MTVRDYAAHWAAEHGWRMLESADVPAGEVVLDGATQTVTIGPQAATITLRDNAAKPLLPPNR